MSKDSWKEECGLFGVFNHRSASEITFLGLYALQHRGQESAGIVSTDGDAFYQKKGLGLVSDVFDRSVIDRLLGTAAVGHNRYSTTGSTMLPNVQPILVELRGEPVSLAHNGNLVNAAALRRQLKKEGSIFQTSMDSELILHLMARSREKSLPGALIDALNKVKGSFSIILLTKDMLIAAKDPRGFRPLCVGKQKGSHIITSESCALDIVGGELIRELKPGEMAICRNDNLEYMQWSEPKTGALCIFEYIYFSRPDSVLDGHSVHGVRKEMGRELAREHPVDADVVISVPDSSNAAALGYSEASGIPQGFGLIRNHYIGRTFIDPSQSVRDFQARIKYNPVKEVLKGKRVVVVDDSIVRGTTSRMLVKLLKDAGAKEVHFRIASSPIIAGCYYGIDTPNRSKLIAARLSVEEICAFLRADSVGYMSIEGMGRSVPRSLSDYCLACFNEDYPIRLEEHQDKLALENTSIKDVEQDERRLTSEKIGRNGPAS